MMIPLNIRAIIEKVHCGLKEIFYTHIKQIDITYDFIL